ncbi:UDP-GalNAc:beta-1,3-N-acetylgalactosaminyltransferase 2 [Caerostris darwini]|uniref:Hexosyltransferase n=1 Tax=Caerostris darwini TaxID=1538125 RepID=A0AAV4SG50_9ARAC|nr:UDP-GalNAc:beta-1,3-N-acetylgalactosaminyltransferase 2 [Caerostris darwini]
MFFWFKSLVCVFSAVFLSFYYEDFVRLQSKILSFREKTVLAVGILSAQGNFEQREAARSTWLKKYSSENNDVKAWFIVGKDSCKIPPEYRVDPYSCEKWNINISGLKDAFYSSIAVQSSACFSEKRFYQGFSFHVNFPVVIEKLGILSSLLIEGHEATVSIMDVQTLEKITQVRISTNYSESNGYAYKNIDALLFPKNYEGWVLVEGYLKDTACTNIVWNYGGGVITYNRIYPTPDHLSSKKYSSEMYPAPSIGFIIPEMNKLREIINEEESVTNQWSRFLKKINKMLKAEVTTKKDIFIVDTTDTYRSLPNKLLKFYQWLYLNYDFSFVMKTDDDSVVNIPYLLKKLQEDSQFDPSQLWLWSNLRTNWQVNYLGKWMDYEYRSTNYPSFPCGAAYIFSQKIALWLTQNAEILYTYQGEDVSIGIWLSAINPNFIEDENFECDEYCKPASYNRAQLNPDKIFKVWSYFERCQSLCSCHSESGNAV